MFKTIAFCRPIILEAEYIQNLSWNYELLTPLNWLTHYAKQPAQFSDLKGLGQKIELFFLTLSPTSVNSLHPSRLSSLTTFSLEAVNFPIAESVAVLGLWTLIVDKLTSRHNVVSDATRFQFRQTLDILQKVK